MVECVKKVSIFFLSCIILPLEPATTVGCAFVFCILLSFWFMFVHQGSGQVVIYWRNLSLFLVWACTFRSAEACYAQCAVYIFFSFGAIRNNIEVHISSIMATFLFGQGNTRRSSLLLPSALAHFVWYCAKAGGQGSLSRNSRRKGISRDLCSSCCLGLCKLLP